MTSPIGRIGSQAAVTRDNGSDGHEQVSRKLDGQDPRAKRIDPRVQKKVQDVAQMYERQFLGEMFKAMRSTVHETDKPSMAQDIYQSQRDEQYIDAWAGQGGIGFSKIIYEQVMEKFFGQTPQGASLKRQGPVSVTTAPIARVSQMKNGVATPIIPQAAAVSAPAPAKSLSAIQPAPLNTSAAEGERLTVENTEPMPAPTPAPLSDDRSLQERVDAKELFPITAIAKPIVEKADTFPIPNPTQKTETPNAKLSTGELFSPSQHALQIEVRPSPTGEPAKIQAPWDATVVQSTKLDGGKTAVTLQHGGAGLRSTLVFDGVLSAGTTAGQKIPRGQAIGTLNQDAKSFLWNLATKVGSNESEPETSGQD